MRLTRKQKAIISIYLISVTLAIAFDHEKLAQVIVILSVLAPLFINEVEARKDKDNAD